MISTSAFTSMCIFAEILRVHSQILLVFIPVTLIGLEEFLGIGQSEDRIISSPIDLDISIS